MKGNMVIVTRFQFIGKIFELESIRVGQVGVSDG